MSVMKRFDRNRPMSQSVYFEFIPIGRAVKVIAMCSATGEEVAIVGDSRASQSDLEQLALRRLIRKLEQFPDEPPVRFRAPYSRHTDSYH